MAVQAIRPTPLFQVDIAHLEEGMRTYTAVTLGPFRSLIHHIFPMIGAVSSVPLRRNDPSQETMMPFVARNQIFNEIDQLSQAAKLRKTPQIHTSLSSIFSNIGGTLSLSDPILFIPHQHLFRQQKNPFTQETEGDQLKNDPWNFTDDETRYLISRQIAQLKNGALLRIAVKIILFTVLYFAYSFPLFWAVGALIGFLALLTYFISERKIEAQSDLGGVEILARRLNDHQRAKGAALSALEKLRQQNILKRNASALCRIYITSLGTHLADFAHPSYISSLERVRNNPT